MSVNLEKMVVMKRPKHANFTDMNHLGLMYQTKPEMLDSILKRAFTAQRMMENPIQDATSMMVGSTKTISTWDWEWELMGAAERPLYVMEDVETDNPYPGLGRKEFKIKLDMDWYKPTDIITPADKRYKVRVQREPVAHGDGFIYVVRLHSDDASLYMPKKYLVAGQRFAKLFTSAEEGGEQSGSFQMAAPFRLRSQMSRFRQEYSITGDANDQVLLVALMDESGKIHKNGARWINYQEAEFWIQWYKFIERGIWYNEQTNTVPGANGRPARTGPGIQALLRYSHVDHYNKLTTKLLVDYLMDIFYSRVSFANRSTKAFSGEYGILAFHNAIKGETEGLFRLDTTEVKNTSGSHSNSLQYGFQYVKYLAPNGVTIEVGHNPLYDDPAINFEYHPVMQVPVESMRLTFLDFGNVRGGANVQMVKLKNGYKYGYVHGLTGPAGPVQGAAMAHAGDRYGFTVQDTCGVHIEDISRCGELILETN